ncbi:MAG: hypothetical protein RL088_3118 [Verrucomicrobiota bacterium]|jgi:hypothetical protein
MHRILSIFFVVVCTALAWWALELQGKLVLKEKEILTLRKERDAAQAAEKVARAELAPLQENAERLRKERDEALGNPKGAAVADAASPIAPAAEDSASRLIGGILKQMDSPEMKNMIRSQQTAETRKTYGKLLKRWNLSPAESDTVLTILAEREMGDISDVLSLASGKADKDTVESIGKSLEEGKTKADERLKAVLGDERMKELEAFDTDQEREQTVGRYAEHLDIGGSPLHPEQRVQLADLIKKEGSDAPHEQEQISALATGSMTDEQLAKLRKATEERQARITQKAAAFLSPDQVSGLQSAFREENNEQDSSFRFLREMMKEAKPGESAIRVAPKVHVEIKTGSSIIPAKP